MVWFLTIYRQRYRKVIKKQAMALGTEDEAAAPTTTTATPVKKRKKAGDENDNVGDDLETGPRRRDEP